MDSTLFEKFRDDSQERIRHVMQLPKGAHLHLCAICGTGMGSIASLLKQLGYYVSGSDKRFYPPMGDIVRGVADRLYEGYHADNLVPVPDLVVIGNNLSVDNPEVQVVLKNKIPFASMPEVLRALLIGDYSYCAHSVVVAGTHGKTTTTAAIATMLEHAGRRPGYFIGGVALSLPSTVRAPDLSAPAQQRVSVLEGDEYDSAFFAKWPKFLSYRPDILVITSLEFDHADIYENVTEIETEFSRIVSMVPEGGKVFVSDQGPSLNRLVASWCKKYLCGITVYGESCSATLSILSRKVNPDARGQNLEFKLLGGIISVATVLSGAQNGYNLLAAAAVGEALGLSPSEISAGLGSFSGVLRRQSEYRMRNGGLLVEDFAHHPTAVRVTLEGLREQYPNRRIVVAFEPRSNTSMRSVFQSEYGSSFKSADIVLLLDVGKKNVYSATSAAMIPLDLEKLTHNISDGDTVGYRFRSVAEIHEWINSNSLPEDVVVCMSNGDFGGLIEGLKHVSLSE